ncbi:Ubiquitin conjugation factor E4 [Kluyveromyces marxianus]|nr:Ubiquitin conjugation factor E4 [Kluyveromyces marxianus]KAG0681721.1 Ubiquitin conjugation factor E4 [Kluyveromyces marxianus]
MTLLRDIFMVTLDPNDSKGYTFIGDLEDVSELSGDSVDSILLYQLTENEGLDEGPVQYLNSCFQRCQQFKRISKKSLNEQQTAILQEIDRLIIGYALVCFEVEEFAIKGSLEQYIVNILRDLDKFTDLLQAMINRAIQEGTLFEFAESFFRTLQSHIMKLDSQVGFDMSDSSIYNNVLTLFELFVSFKPMANIFTSLPGFFADHTTEANQFEKVTLMGPILSLSPLQTAVALKNYIDPDTQSQKQTNMIHTSLQTEHNVVLQRLFFIVDKIIRASQESRSDLLTYFGHIVNKNHLRRGDHAQANKLASNAFMTNITLILIKFSLPFLDVSYKKIDKIDVNYFNNLNLYIDLNQETRMNSDIKEADEFYEQNKKSDQEEPNFISHCFFLTLTYLHYGIGGTILFDERYAPEITKLKEHLTHLRQVISNSQNSMMARFGEIQLKQLEKRYNHLSSIHSACQGFFSNKTLHLEVFDFISGASTFLIRVIDPSHQYPFYTIELPLIPDQIGVENVDNAEYLRKNAPVPFKYYPEFVIEGLINYCQYVTKYVHNPLFKNPRLHSYIELATVILRCPELISNPHLKGKMVQVLSIGAMPMSDNTPGFMMEIFENNDIVLKNLLYGLLDFYVIVEKTGSSSQFYDKFNARYSISIILEALYNIPHYRKQLLWQSQNNSDFFIRFVARMLNDLTFLLDEGLSTLAEVHNLQHELENRSKGLPPSREEDTQELQSRLKSAERQAKSSCGLSEKSLVLFNIFTNHIPEAFASAEIVDRLAAMLDYNLEMLVGSKCRELKVKDLSKYQFNPKTLLQTLATIYINLANEPDFVAAVARDGRSFNKELFKKAVHILSVKTGLFSEEKSRKLLNFAEEADKMRLQEEQEDLEMNDAPDEFLDPLMYTIMNDPVILPTSKVTIDRSTIKAHLLSDSTDPFNRSPLKLEDVIPNEELKRRIAEFKKSKRLNRD